MIRFLILLFCLLPWCTCMGQATSFQLDERGLITYSEVVNVEGLNADQLVENVLDFFENNHQNRKRGKMRYRKIETPEAGLTYAGSFILYKKSLGKVPEGKVSYHITFEAKDSRYRYIIRQFHFIPYKRNRYGRFVPVRGQPLPLESYLPQQENTWSRNFTFIDSRIEHITQKLKEQVQEIPIASEDKEIVKLSNDW